MTAWTTDELTRIDKDEELLIATLRRDGTLRKKVIIWVVRVGDDLYVRSVNGRDGAWFRGLLARHEGRIQAGGVDREVTFVEEADPALNDRVDAAYRLKYRRYSLNIVNSILTPLARAATIRLVPK